MKGDGKIWKNLFLPAMRGSCPGTLLSPASTQFVVVGWPQTVHMKKARRALKQCLDDHKRIHQN